MDPVNNCKRVVDFISSQADVESAKRPRDQTTGDAIKPPASRRGPKIPIEHFFFNFVLYSLDSFDRRECLEQFGEDQRPQLFKALDRFPDEDQHIPSSQLVLVTQELDQLLLTNFFVCFSFNAAEQVGK